MALRTMVMDGNFIMHRFARDYDFLAFPEEDMIGYKIDLAQHISAELERVRGFVDNIIIVKDSKSWRKSTEQVTHICTETGEPEIAINYKENRKGAPKSERNDALLFQSFNEFTDTLERDFNIPVTQVYGAEGDDAIWAWVKYLRENNIFSCVYCSDSDIIQTVSPSNAIIRRIRSKVSQDGEIILHPMIYQQMNEFASDPFNYNPLKWQHEKVMIGQRTLDSGLRVENPNWTKLQLIMMGSGKDNVLEVFNWPSNTGRQTRHINPRHVVEALDKVNLTTDVITEQLLYDDAFLEELFLNTVNAAQPKRMNESVTTIFESFVSNKSAYLGKMKSNRKMGLLNTLEIPQSVQDDLMEKIKSQSTMQADFKGLERSQNICEAMNVTKNKMFNTLGI